MAAKARPPAEPPRGSEHTAADGAPDVARRARRAAPPSGERRTGHEATERPPLKLPVRRPSHFPGPDQRAPVDYGRLGRDLRAAIITGVLLGGSIVATLTFFRFGFILIVAALLIMATVELGQNFRARGITVSSVPIAIGTGVAFILPYLSEYIPSINGEGDGLGRNAVLLGVLGVTAIVALAWRIRGGSEGYLADVSASLFLVAYVPLLGSFVALLLAGEQGVARVVTFILVVVMSDTGGYIVGVLFGRHPMAPVISPKKSWEGFAGSVGFATAAAILMAVFGLQAPWWVGLILGPCLVAVGTVGDLVESLIKRDLGIKDMSSFLPGHGGVMDRLDSLLLAAPVGWLIMYLLIPGG